MVRFSAGPSFFFPQHSKRFWKGALSPTKKRHGSDTVRFHLHLGPKLKIRGAVTPLHRFPSWHAQGEHLLFLHVRSVSINNI